jgi:hypothetical protein
MGLRDGNCKLQLNERLAVSFLAESYKHHYAGTLPARPGQKQTACTLAPPGNVPTFEA